MLIEVLNNRTRLKSKFIIWKISSRNSPKYRVKRQRKDIRQKVRWRSNTNKRSKKTDITKIMEENK